MRQHALWQFPADPFNFDHLIKSYIFKQKESFKKCQKANLLGLIIKHTSAKF
jgi:hypothetical protein